MSDPKNFKAIFLFLAGGALLVAQSVGAETADIGHRVLSTIRAGSELSSLKIFHPNYVPEGQGVATLRGCDYSVQPLSTPRELHVDWVCPNPKYNAFTRIYLPNGKLSRLEFQPGLKLMAPSKVGLGMATLPSRKTINKQFENAVKSGSDPTLGGLIPVTPDHLLRLKQMKGWGVFRTDLKGDYGANTLWFNSLRNPTQGADTTLHFDSSGRPIGLWLRGGPILSVRADEVM